MIYLTLQQLLQYKTNTWTDPLIGLCFLLALKKQIMADHCRVQSLFIMSIKLSFSPFFFEPKLGSRFPYPMCGGVGAAKPFTLLHKLK